MTNISFSLKNEPIKKSFIYLLAEFFNHFYKDENIFILDLSHKGDDFKKNDINRIFKNIKVENFKCCNNDFDLSQHESRINFDDSRAICFYNNDAADMIDKNIDKFVNNVNSLLEKVIEKDVEKIFVIIPEESKYKKRLSESCLLTYDVKLKSEAGIEGDYNEQPVALLDKSIIQAIKAKKISLPKNNDLIFQSKWLVSVLQLANKVQKNEPFLELFLDAVACKH